MPSIDPPPPHEIHAARQRTARLRRELLLAGLGALIVLGLAWWIGHTIRQGETLPPRAVPR